MPTGRDTPPNAATASKAEGAMTYEEALNLVDLWTVQKPGQTIPAQTPATLRMWGAENSARALEEALSIVGGRHYGAAPRAHSAVESAKLPDPTTFDLNDRTPDCPECGAPLYLIRVASAAYWQCDECDWVEE